MDITITFTITPELVEEVVKSIMENFPEASSGNTLKCTNWHYESWLFRFTDTETNINYPVTKTILLTAFPLLFTDKWSKDLTQPPWSGKKADWDNWLCACDAGDHDAYVQLAIFGEVIYG